MSGIAGINKAGEVKSVRQMLDKIAHRGTAGRAIIENENATMGITWTRAEKDCILVSEDQITIQDTAGESQFARVRNISRKNPPESSLFLERDHLGISPLYYLILDDGYICFASEVKALLGLSGKIYELQPGHRYDGRHLEKYYTLVQQSNLSDKPENIAAKLRKLLNDSVQKRIVRGIDEEGAWLSGGLDSCTIVALACKHAKTILTFAAGLPNSPDLKYARDAAEYLGTKHHEIIISPKDLLSVMPRVVYHLESFDALLVRSSIPNFLAGERASEYVQSVFSGEGSDELFAGYDYLKDVPSNQLNSELVDIISRLHNTALQRVDRMASAHGIIAYVPFLDPDIVRFSLQIPAKYKIYRKKIEKWILRQAASGLLPESVLNRRKAKFWQGAGIGEQLSDYANKHIKDADFRKERILDNGWELNTKEELMYYRVFQEHFGEICNLSWMGRSKGAPKSN